MGVTVGTFTVVVADNFHYGDASQHYILGDFATHDEAVEAARKVVDEYLASAYEPGMAVSALYDSYKSFGEDPFITSTGSEQGKFSAWDYAESRSVEICRGRPYAKELAPLQVLPLQLRLEAVAEDVRHLTHQYSGIDAHDLAEVLGVSDPWRPGSGWTFTSYAEIEAVEAYAQRNDPASELVHFLENEVSETRLAELVRLSEPLDEVSKPRFDFLTRSERKNLERRIAEAKLESNQSNGICCIANYSIALAQGESLEFEGDIEDDGACITLRTPYDQRAGRFRDLSNCVTDSW